jgi:dihydroxyacid dehydratase/phosphogluconate dehydratase
MDEKRGGDRIHLDTKNWEVKVGVWERHVKSRKARERKRD